MLSEHQVEVKALKDGRWAQEPWKKQLEVVKGDKVKISISFATRFEEAGLCKIVDKNPHVAKQVKVKDEKGPWKKDKKAAEG